MQGGHGPAAASPQSDAMARILDACSHNFEHTPGGGASQLPPSSKLEYKIHEIHVASGTEGTPRDPSGKNNAKWRLKMRQLRRACVSSIAFRQLESFTITNTSFAATSSDESTGMVLTATTSSSTFGSTFADKTHHAAAPVCSDPHVTNFRSHPLMSQYVPVCASSTYSPHCSVIEEELRRLVFTEDVPEQPLDVGFLVHDKDSSKVIVTGLNFIDVMILRRLDDLFSSTFPRDQELTGEEPKACSLKPSEIVLDVILTSTGRMDLCISSIASSGADGNTLLDMIVHRRRPYHVVEEGRSPAALRAPLDTNRTAICDSGDAATPQLALCPVDCNEFRPPNYRPTWATLQVPNPFAVIGNCTSYVVSRCSHVIRKGWTGRTNKERTRPY